MNDKKLIEYREQWTCYYKQKQFGRKAIMHNLRLVINKKISSIARSMPESKKDDAFWDRMNSMRNEYLTFDWQTCSQSNKRLRK